MLRAMDKRDLKDFFQRELHEFETQLFERLAEKADKIGESLLMELSRMDKHTVNTNPVYQTADRLPEEPVDYSKQDPPRRGPGRPRKQEVDDGQ